MPSFAYTHDIQLVHFGPNQVESLGAVEVQDAVRAFRSFPFREQLIQAERIPEPTVPTLSFRSSPDDAALAIWSLADGQYEIHLRVQRRDVTVVETDPGEIEQLIRSFFAGERVKLMDELRDPSLPPAPYQDAPEERGIRRGEALLLSAVALLGIAVNLSFLVVSLILLAAWLFADASPATAERHVDVALMFTFMGAVLTFLAVSCNRGGYVWRSRSEKLWKHESPGVYRLMLTWYYLMAAAMTLTGVAIWLAFS